MSEKVLPKNENKIDEQEEVNVVDLPDPLAQKLVEKWKRFAIGFYEADNFKEQAQIVKDFHDVLKAVSKKEEEDKIVKKADLQEQEADEAAPRTLKDFKEKVSSFMKDITTAKKLVQKAQQLTKKNLLTGREVRGQIINFIKKMQEDAISLNSYILALAPQPIEEGVLEEVESYEDYKTKVEQIENAHDAILKQLGPAIQDIIEGKKVVWAKIREMVGKTLETLKNITKFFPTMIPFEQGQVENEKLMDAFEDALLGFKIGAADVKALQDAQDGDVAPDNWPRLVSFQKRLIKFSSELERIFGIPGLAPNSPELPPEQPQPASDAPDDQEDQDDSDTEAADDTDAEEQPSFERDAAIQRAKNRFPEYANNPLFEGLSPAEQEDLLAFIGALIEDTITEANGTFSPGVLFGPRAISKFKNMPQDIKDKALTILKRDDKLEQLRQMISPKKDSPAQKETLNLTNTTEINTYFTKLYTSKAADIKTLGFNEEQQAKLKQVIMYVLLYKKQPITEANDSEDTSFKPKSVRFLIKLGIEKDQVSKFATFLKGKADKLTNFINEISEEMALPKLQRLGNIVSDINDRQVDLGNLTYTNINNLYEEPEEAEEETEAETEEETEAETEEETEAETEEEVEEKWDALKPKIMDLEDRDLPNLMGEFESLVLLIANNPDEFYFYIPAGQDYEAVRAKITSAQKRVDNLEISYEVGESAYTREFKAADDFLKRIYHKNDTPQQEQEEIEDIPDLEDFEELQERIAKVIKPLIKKLMREANG